MSPLTKIEKPAPLTAHETLHLLSMVTSWIVNREMGFERDQRTHGVTPEQQKEALGTLWTQYTDLEKKLDAWVRWQLDQQMADMS